MLSGRSTTEGAAMISDPAGRAALDWFGLILVEQDIGSAWPLTHPNLRRCLVDQYIYENGETVDAVTATIGSILSGVTDVERRQHLATALAAERPSKHRWMPVLHRWLLGFLAGIPSGPWTQVGSRVVDLDLVLVEFVPPGVMPPVGGESRVPGVTLLMSFDGDRWLIASFKDRPPRPAARGEARPTW
jgi:hypothetical protein